MSTIHLQTISDNCVDFIDVKGVSEVTDRLQDRNAKFLPPASVAFSAPVAACVAMGRSDERGRIMERVMMKKFVLPGCCLFAMLLSACSNAEGDAQAVVKAILTDPASAQFQAVLIKGDFVCGEVNSKNKMGGYVGFRRFYVDQRGKGVAVVDPREWASPNVTKYFGKEILTPSNDTATFETKYARVCT